MCRRSSLICVFLTTNDVEHLFTGLLDKSFACLSIGLVVFSLLRLLRILPMLQIQILSQVHDLQMFSPGPWLVLSASCVFLRQNPLLKISFIFVLLFHYI